MFLWFNERLNFALGKMEKAVSVLLWGWIPSRLRFAHERTREIRFAAPANQQTFHFRMRRFLLPAHKTFRRDDPAGQPLCVIVDDQIHVRFLTWTTTTLTERNSQKIIETRSNFLISSVLHASLLSSSLFWIKYFWGTHEMLSHDAPSELISN